jgi:hypothetical protein
MRLQRWLRGTGGRWALPAGVIALLAVAAVGIATRKQVTLPDDRLSRSQLAVAVIVVLGLGVVAFVLLILFSKGEQQLSEERKRESMIVRLLRLVIIFGLLYLIVANWDRFTEPMKEVDSGGRAPTDAGTRGADLPFWSWPIALATLAVAATITVLVILAARRAPTPTGVEQQTNEQAEQIRAVLARGRASLATQGDARDRVLRAYAAMEQALANAGIAKRIADTPAELLARASVGDLFGPQAAGAADRLAELFREARFSERPLPDSAPDDAAAALETLERDLGERVLHR